METSLILTAKSWQLAGHLERSKSHGGVQFVKNVPERTYLCITSKQWALLQRFAEPRTIPQVLEASIEERTCPALGEFYELILKAVRARILVQPNQTVAPFPAANWPVSLNPARWRKPLWVFFWVGLVATVALRPALPLDWRDAVVGAGLWALAAVLGPALAASLLRGAGGEVYFRGWRMCTADACMLAPSEQRTVAVAPLAVLSALTGVLAWRRPEWGFLPLAGLLLQMRPILGGAINDMIRVGAAARLGDAEHRFIFTGNRTVGQRSRLLRASLQSGATWLEIGYGIAWTLLLAFLFGTLAEVPPWRLVFWQTQGLRLALAAGGSLFLLGVIYAGLEAYVFLRDRARARHETMRLWYRRWFRREHVATDDSARLQALLQSPLRLLPPPEQQMVAKVLKPFKAGAWQVLHPIDQPVSHVSLVLSGRVGVYRQVASGRRVLLQVLCENDLVGLHAAADPGQPEYLYRTLTPVVLLRMEWGEAVQHVLPRLTTAILANHVHKAPFLMRISLCQNWHRQAIQRFAELSRVRDYGIGEVILEQGSFSESFFIVLEGEAHVMIAGNRVATIGVSSFFGEIGLLQNSNATARVVARTGTRCLCIPRREFLRFVAHNHTVALELERVSSRRLGRPIFPLSPGNFRTH